MQFKVRGVFFVGHFTDEVVDLDEWSVSFGSRRHEWFLPSK